jgi:hypothetical protein
MRRVGRIALLLAGGAVAALLPVGQAEAMLADREIPRASIPALVGSAREAARVTTGTRRCEHLGKIIEEIRRRSPAVLDGPAATAYSQVTGLAAQYCPQLRYVAPEIDLPFSGYVRSRFLVDFSAGAIEQKGATHGFLGVDIAGTPFLPFTRFQPRQSGEFFSGNASFRLDNGGQLFFNGTLFQSTGSSFQEPTLVPGDFLLIPFVETPGVSLNNIGDLAALGPQSFNIQQQGFAFTTTYAFPPIAANGTTITPLVHVGAADTVTESSFLFTVPGYTAAGRYGSDVNQLVLRAGVGARVETPVPDLLSSDVVARQMRLFVEGRIGVAHHRVASGETVDLSVFGGALTFAEATSIRANATGVELTAILGINGRWQPPAGNVLRVGAGVFCKRDTRGAFTRVYPGGTPVGRFEDNVIFGSFVQAGVEF